MLTFQDFEAAADKEKFILKAIESFKSSKMYKNAIDADLYYQEENTTILARRKTFIGEGMTVVDDITKANNQIPSGFFPVIIKQANNYLIGKGIDLGDEDKIKDNLGKNFDIKVQRAGISAHISGVSWAYCFLGGKGEFDIDIWKGIEFIPLLDESNGLLRAGIRFWQIDSSKPLYIELYEESGKSKYKIKDNKVGMIEDRKSYIIVRSKDALEETIIGESNWSMLPIVPLYIKDNHKGDLTQGLKNKIDLYDIIQSDFGNNLEDMQDVYWVLKNYGGQDLGQFINDYKYYKSIKVQGEGDATPHTIEIPWQARKEALEILRKDIYEGAMAIDTEKISGGNITNLDIKAMFTNLDLKTNEFEWNLKDFIDGIITLYKEFSNDNTEYGIKFTRSTLVNESEIISNIVLFREDISQRKALELNPMISNDEIDKIIDETEAQSVNKIEIPPAPPIPGEED